MDPEHVHRECVMGDRACDHCKQVFRNQTTDFLKHLRASGEKVCLQHGQGFHLYYTQTAGPCSECVEIYTDGSFEKFKELKESWKKSKYIN